MLFEVYLTISKNNFMLLRNKSYAFSELQSNIVYDLLAVRS